MEALIIGKFEIIHKEHVFLLKQIAKKKEIDNLIICIADNKNMLISAEDRIQLLNSILEKFNQNYEIYVVDDIPNDKKYAEHVLKTIERKNFKDIILFSGNPNTLACFKEKRIKILKPKIKYPVSSSKILEMIITDSKWKKYVPKSTISYFNPKNIKKLKKRAFELRDY